MALLPSVDAPIGRPPSFDLLPSDGPPSIDLPIGRGPPFFDLLPSDGKASAALERDPWKITWGGIDRVSTCLEVVQESARIVISCLNRRPGYNKGKKLELQEIIEAEEHFVAGSLYCLVIKASDDQLYKAEVYWDLLGRRILKDVKRLVPSKDACDGDSNVAARNGAGKIAGSSHSAGDAVKDAGAPPSSVRPSTAALLCPPFHHSHSNSLPSHGVRIANVKPYGKTVQSAARIAMCHLRRGKRNREGEVKELRLKEVVKAVLDSTTGTEYFLTIKASDNQLYEAKVICNPCETAVEYVVPRDADDARKVGESSHNTDEAGKDGYNHKVYAAGKSDNSYNANDEGKDGDNYKVDAALKDGNGHDAGKNGDDYHKADDAGDNDAGKG